MKIKPSEFRIGNWVKYIDDKRVKPELRGKAVQLIPDDILAMTEGYDFIIEPIPINREELLKLGFKIQFIMAFLEFENGYIAISLADNSCLISNGKKEDFGRMIGYNLGKIRKKYIHEIQNLYFELTHEELPIKKLEEI